MTVPIRPLRTDGREGTFDRLLALEARSLVVDALPADILAAQRPVTAHPWHPFGAPLAAGVAIVVLAIGFAIGGPRSTGSNRAFALRTGDEISVVLRSSGYSCRPGTAASPGRPRMDALVCTQMTAPHVASVIVSEDPSGRVGEIHVDSDIVGTPTTTADRDGSDLLLGLIGMPFGDPADAAAARAWLTAQLPLVPGDRVSTTVDAVPVVLERGSRGGYLLVLGDLGVSPSAVPSR